jgi:hypothetical protein
MVEQWMTPEKGWALKMLESAVIQKGKRWSWCEKIKDQTVLSNILIKAVKCGDFGNEWVGSMCTSGLLKNITTMCRYESYGNVSKVDSALVRALMMDNYGLAEKMLTAGYRIANPEYMSELEVGIKLSLNVKGIEFLLKNGCSPMETNGNEWIIKGG